MKPSPLFVAEGSGSSDKAGVEVTVTATATPDAFKPDTCQCQNGGMCDSGECVCPGFTSGDLCQVKSPCYESPCIRGSCKEAAGEDGAPSYTCDCGDNFYGDNCELKTGCYANPCEHGGVCTPNRDRFTCTCPESRSGPTCGTYSSLAK